MNNYIIGYTSVEYNVGGILLPKKTYTAEEKATGKKEVTKVNEVELKTLRANKVFVALENTKKIRVLDQLPSWAVSGADREAALQARIKELEGKGVSKKVSTLEAALETSNKEKENITNEAQKVIDELRAENEQLKAKVSESDKDSETSDAAKDKE